jgi:hypothetical protein
MRGRKRLVIARWIQWGAPALIAVFALIEKKWPVAASPSERIRDLLLKGFLEWNFVGVLVLVGLLLAAKAMEYYVESSQADTRQLKGMVETLHAAYFNDIPPGERYQNRVTLFRANRQRTELGAVCRSGHLYPKGIQALAINENNEAGNEGVAGQAWVTDSTVYRALPEVPEVWSDDDPVCQAYASDGLLPTPKAGKLHVKSRSLLATPVRSASGARWGVLCIDSRRPDGIDPAKEHLVTMIVGAISNVL